MKFTPKFTMHLSGLIVWYDVQNDSLTITKTYTHNHTKWETNRYAKQLTYLGVEHHCMLLEIRTLNLN